jgi:hypothetical protein
VATTKRLPRLTARDRAHWQAKVRDLQDAENDTELTPEQRESLLGAVNARRARNGRPPLRIEDWEDTPPTVRSETAD